MKPKTHLLILWPLLLGCFFLSSFSNGQTPTAAFSADQTRIVEGESIAFDASSSTGENLTFEWAFDGGEASSSTTIAPTVIYSTAGSYDVTLTVTDGSGNKATETKIEFISVFDLPVADFTGEPDFIGVGETVAFDASASTGENITFEWEFEGGDPASSSDPNPSITYISPGTFDVVLTVTDEFGNSDSKTENDYITVEAPDVLASFSGEPTTLLAGESVVFDGSASEGSSLTFDWNFAGGEPETSDSPQPTIRYNIPGTYDVTLTITDAFGNSDTATEAGLITVEAPDIAAIFSAGSTTVPIGEPVSFDATASIGQNLSFAWTFEGGEPITSDSPQPSVSYALPGTYDVSLTVTDELGNTDTSLESDFITVEAPEVIAEIRAEPTSILTGETVNFDASASSGQNLSYSWAFEGGEPETSDVVTPSVTYPNAGAYNVTLTVTDEFGNSDTFTENDFITVNVPSVVAAFAGGPTEIMINETVSFDASASSGEQLSFEWFFEGGDPETSTLIDPVISYPTPGTFDVTLIVTNGAGQSDTALQTDFVSVEGPPVFAAFTGSPTSLLASESVTFDATASLGQNLSFIWSFEGGEPGSSTSPTPTVLYNVPGTYDVTLTVTDEFGTSDSVTETDLVEVGTPPAAAIFIGSPTAIEAGEMAFFDASASTGFNLGYQWTFAGGEPETADSPAPNVTYHSPGSFDVTLIVTDALGTADTLTQIGFITATTPETKASFTSNVTSVEQGNVVQFINTSTGLDLDYSWFFQGGEPLTSTEENPVVTYPQVGTFDVRLTVTDPSGTSNGLSIESYIEVAPITGLAETLLQQVSVYPNPFDQYLFISSENAATARLLDARLFDVSGKKHPIAIELVSASQWGISTKNLPQGMYILELELQPGVWGKVKINKGE